MRYVPSPLHPSARDDVGTIAAQRQADEGAVGEADLMEKLCPFQLLYADGVERLGAESARERVRWVSAIWLVRVSKAASFILMRVYREALDHSVTIPDRSVNSSPVGSIRTIASHQSSALSAASASSAGSRYTFDQLCTT